MEETLAQRAVQWPFCFGDRPGWADLHLVPQISAARRLEYDLSRYPLLLSRTTLRSARPFPPISTRRPT
ncbi:hypothetical protein [Sinorhizobium meliloti]|uniref:hypothetical protein n=1 Tax=Rhizobium meliloti TaxID=382 RepID=UPI001912D0AE|nr:hypothetical protein [Sinorhizobium meliloti]